MSRRRRDGWPAEHWFTDPIRIIAIDMTRRDLFPDTFDRFAPRERGRFGENESVARSTEHITHLCLQLVLHHETSAAIKVSEDGVEARAVWLPRTAITIQPGGRRAGEGVTSRGQLVRLPIITVTVPERLAKEKGLI